ncbi:MAG TPA: RNA pseudouridine synthase [bacterium]|nr:RNA pseudouridine synthase [bacterium]
MSGGLLILRESDNELVLFKPAGLSSEFKSDTDGVSAKALVAKRHPGADPKLPHRLDRVTRGILLVCLSQEAIAFQNAEIKAGRWEKYYLARVAAPAGKGPADLIGEHAAYLKEEKGRSKIVHAGGKSSRLEILGAAPVPGMPDRWHLLIRLLTGRFHQIRVMCAGMGLPLTGDPLYDPEQRDPAEFYLEHLILKYTPFDTKKPTTLHLPDLTERGPLSPELSELIALIVKREPLFS